MKYVSNQNGKNRIIFALIIFLVASSFASIGCVDDAFNTVDNSWERAAISQSFIDHSFEAILEADNNLCSNNYLDRENSRPELVKRGVRNLLGSIIGCTPRSSSILYTYQQLFSIFACVLLLLLINIYFIHQKDGSK